MFIVTLVFSKYKHNISLKIMNYKKIHIHKLYYTYVNIVHVNILYFQNNSQVIFNISFCGIQNYKGNKFLKIKYKIMN